MLVAGHETTGHSMAWTLWLIAIHPHVTLKIKQEIDTTTTDDALVHDPLCCPYLTAVIYESLRLKPASANGTGRVMQHSIFINGVRLREGDKVSCAFYSVHTATHLWGADAMSFRPERWLNQSGLNVRCLSLLSALCSLLFLSHSAPSLSALSHSALSHSAPSLSALKGTHDQDLFPCSFSNSLAALTVGALSLWKLSHCGCTGGDCSGDLTS